MTPKEIHDQLKARFGDRIAAFAEIPVDPYLLVTRDGLVDVCRALRDGAEYGFDLLASVSGMDLGGDRLASVYHLFSTKRKHRVVLRVEVTRADAAVPTVEGIWPAAGWHEREAWDLLGIDYPGHTDLRRILCPDEWAGHPLRKDYVFPKEFKGITLE